MYRDNGSPAKTSVDGTDFRTVEHTPFDSGRYTHKFHGPGLRYEIALALATGWIVWINGPFRCGNWPDLRIARSALHDMIPRGEFYLADCGYRARDTPVVTKNDIPANERDRMNKLMARHETVNTRFKDWGILLNRFDFAEEKHAVVFYAIAVITQIEIASGMFDWGEI